MTKLMTALTTAAVLLGAASASLAQGKEEKKVPPVLQFKMNSLDGNPVDLAKYQGKVVLFVNVASQCGYTPQYKALQALHTKYAKDDLVIIGVPSNDYGKQEPGSDKEIADFCTKNYGVTFDMLSKVSVANGKEQCALYKYLTSKETNPKFAGAVKWNFEKFLIGRDGTIVARFASNVDPASEKFDKAIKTQLNK